MEKKDLVKIALSTFILAASLPVAGQAASDGETQGTLLAGGGCAASKGSNPAPASSGCASATNNTAPASHGCQAGKPNSIPNVRPDSANPNINNNAQSEDDDSDDSDSSYQGTTTGPGPNGGYPGTPRGSYNPNQTTPNKPIQR